MLRTVKARAHGPVLIHVLTKKGKGYRPAEQARDNGHATAKFDMVTGEQKKAPSNAPSYTSVFGKELARLAARVAELEAGAEESARALAAAAEALEEARAREARVLARLDREREEEVKEETNGGARGTKLAAREAREEGDESEFRFFRASDDDADSFREETASDSTGALAAALEATRRELDETREALTHALQDAAGGRQSPSTPLDPSRARSRLFPSEASDDSDDADEDAIRVLASASAGDGGVPPALVAAVDALARRVETMREDARTLTKERDAARKLLEMATRRERTLRDALREVKRAALADAAAAGARRRGPRFPRRTGGREGDPRAFFDGHDDSEEDADEEDAGSVSPAERTETGVDPTLTRAAAALESALADLTGRGSGR